ncbi:hypothetical protein [Actinoplanes sp. NPDC051411]|uniref:effector-associated domain 2-containing protein n=1 Tax=Actinoplanes sp. NPDC051411 TaxID=3155522 RepID=UPI0034289ED7
MVGNGMGAAVELEAELAMLPATSTPGARRHFTDLIRERVGGDLDVRPETDRAGYLHDLVTALLIRAGGLPALMAVVSHLGPSPAEESAIRSLIGRLEMPPE